MPPINSQRKHQMAPRARIRHRLSAIVFLAGISVAAGMAQLPPRAIYSGCGPPYASCTDPVSATFLTGSWIEDDSSSEWTLTADYAPPRWQPGLFTFSHHRMHGVAPCLITMLGVIFRLPILHKMSKGRPLSLGSQATRIRISPVQGIFPYPA